MKLEDCKKRLNAIDNFSIIHKSYVERKLFLDKSSRINHAITKEYIDGLIELNEYKKTKKKL